MMARLLARSLCCASALAAPVLVSGVALASAGGATAAAPATPGTVVAQAAPGTPAAAVPAPVLRPTELRDARAVGRWLEAHRAAPRTEAEAFQRLGDKASTSRRWGAASKAYGESALLYPAPDVIAAYARALLQERAQTHAAQKAPFDQQQAAWVEASQLLTSALAADDVLRQWKPAQRQSVTADASCLANAAARSSPVATPEAATEAARCAPLRAYRAALGTR